MRFAYVAAGAVVLGAAVSEASPVPPSPQRTPKAAKRQSRPAGPLPIQPLMYTKSAMPDASKAIPFSLKNEVGDGISGMQLVNGPPQLSQPTEAQLPEAQAIPSLMHDHTLPVPSGTLPGADGMGAADIMEIVNVNPTGVPEYMVMKVAGSQGQMAPSNVLSAPRRYQPSPLAGLANTIENQGTALPEKIYYIQQDGKTLAEPVGLAFGAPFSQIEGLSQSLPISGETPMDAFNQATTIANGQSAIPNPMTISKGLPLPLLRALSHVKLPVDQSKIMNPSQIINPSDNKIIPPQANDILPVSPNSIPLSPQAPAPVFRTAQGSADTGAPQNATPLPSAPSLPTNQTAPSADVNALTTNTEKVTIDPSLAANATNTTPSNVTASTSSLPLNTTDTPVPSS